METLTQTERLEGYAPAIGGKATQDGSVERPADMPSRDDATHIVGEKDEFIEGLTTDDAIVYTDDTFKCDILKPIVAGRDVTIVGGHCDPDRNENDGNGPVVHFDYFTERMIQTPHPLTLYGVAFKGPTGEYFKPEDWAAQNENVDDQSAYYSVGVWAYPDKGEGQVKVIGSKLWDFTHAALLLGAKGYETNALVSRSTITDCMMEHLGYGISQYDGTLVVERSDLDRCRHAIAGFGYPSERLIVAETMFGPGPHSSHVIDRHCTANSLPNGDGTAGEFTHIWRCTAMSHGPGEHIQDVNGTNQEFFAIRGASVDESYLDKVDFWAPELPAPTGDNGDALRQETALLDGDGSEWVRLDLRDNATGGNNGPEYGVPLAADDSPGGPADDAYDELRILGYGSRWTDYRLVVDGDAKRRRAAETSDMVESSGDGSVISGSVLAGVDTFAVEAGAPITEAWVTGTARVERDGHAVNLIGPTTARVDERLDALRQRLKRLERDASKLGR